MANTRFYNTIKAVKFVLQFSSDSELSDCSDDDEQETSTSSIPQKTEAMMMSRKWVKVIFHRGLLMNER